MPALAAQYLSMLARACPGMFTESFILYHLPQERGWSYVHSLMVANGEQTSWPDDRNPLRQWWQGILRKVTKTNVGDLAATPAPNDTQKNL